MLFSKRVLVDYEYYLAHQILPPIERLCDPIEGTDRARLAECLGMSSACIEASFLTSCQVWIPGATDLQLPSLRTVVSPRWIHGYLKASVTRTLHRLLCVAEHASAVSPLHPYPIER